MRAFLLEIARILTILLLLRIMCQFVCHASRMRQIENDQLLCHSGKVHRELPRNCTTPIMPYNDRLLFAQMTNDRRDVSNELPHIVVFAALRLIAQIVSPLINGNRLKLLRQRRHLVSPRIPEVGEAVNHDDQRSRAETGIVNFHAIVLSISMFNTALDIKYGGFSHMFAFSFSWSFSS